MQALTMAGGVSRLTGPDHQVTCCVAESSWSVVECLLHNLFVRASVLLNIRSEHPWPIRL